MTTKTDEITALEIRLFGPFMARCQGAPLRSLRTRKGQWLLALLALRQGREVDREWLAGTLWPDSEASQALYGLRRCLTDLRDALGAQAMHISSPTARTLRLDTAGVAVDVTAFDAAIHYGDRPALERAVSLYSGILLEGCLEEWVSVERTAREQALLQALEVLASYCLERNDTTQAVAYLQRLLACDPLQEGAIRLMMRAQAQSGSYAAAVQTYRGLRLRLRRDLRSDPDGETIALYKRLRAEARARLTTAEPIAAPRDEPTLTYAPAYTVPAPPNPLIGRVEEMARALRLLEQSRLVTLMGIGGVGKTRLALAIAEAAAEDFRDGACLTELADVREARDVPATIAQALGLKIGAEADPQASVIEMLRARHLLLVLDNFEQVVEAAPFVGRLLKQCPQVACLITSRNLLQLPGEQWFEVEPLPLPDADSDFDAIRNCSSVQLFTERARAMRRDFVVTPQNAAAVSALCAGLEGIPLALELAAARAQVLTPAQMLAQIQRRFDLLASRSRGVADRHRTLRNALDWSNQLLTEEVRHVFARLSVFRGGWMPEAAAAICVYGEDGSTGEGDGYYEALEALTQLRESSLIQSEERQDVIRFRMLETVREYAGLQLALEERQAVRRRHAAYFLDCAAEAAPHLRGQDQAASLERLEAEHDNMREALDWCVEQEEGAESGLQLTAALWRFWEVRGHWHEGRRRFGEVLKHPQAQQATATRARALNGAAILAWKQGDYAEAKRYYEESLAVNRAIGDRHGIAATLNNLGLVLCDEGDYAHAQTLLTEALQIAEQREDVPSQAAILSSLADAANGAGDDEVALRLYSRCLALKRRLGDMRGIAGVLDSLGAISARRNELELARAYHQQGLALQRHLGDREGIAVSLLNLAHITRQQGDATAAGRLYADSLIIARELGDRRAVVRAIGGIAVVAGMLGNTEMAVRLLAAEKALRVDQRVPATAAEYAAAEAQDALLREQMDPHLYALLHREGVTTSLDRAITAAIGAVAPAESS